MFASESSCQPGIDHYMSDEESCTKYFRCVNGSPVEYRCALGTVWNRRLDRCDFAYGAGCEERQKRHPEILMNYDYRTATPEQLLENTDELMKVVVILTAAFKAIFWSTRA